MSEDHHDPLQSYYRAVHILAGDTDEPTETAVSLLHEASDAGVAEANFYLGQLYEEGKLVQRNPDFAYRHYVRALELAGKDEVWHLAGYFSLIAHPDARICALVPGFFRKAAMAGYRNQMMWMSDVYSGGEYGSRISAILSRQWRKMAAKYGHSRAIEDISIDEERRSTLPGRGP